MTPILRSPQERKRTPGEAEFFKAARLLTILPFPAGREPPRASILMYFPAVGLIVGLLLAALAWLLGPLPASISALLIVAFWILITRGLHMDGVSDTADALFSVADRIRRLEIMRDPHAGPMGMMAVFLVILGKTLALWELAPDLRVPAVLLAAIYARWILVPACALFSYARSEGLGAAYIGKATFGHVAASTACAAGLAYAFGGTAALLLIPLSILAGLGVGLAANRAFGGITGDVLGAMVEVTELAVLLGAACFRPAGLIWV
ncbi:adenosylcobinamide-GDP ribazoletransferase [bacterium]|nr:adenosylcobinamide-GDP ribazoletransferase [bacterium]